MATPRSAYHARCLSFLGACIIAGGSLFAQDGVLDLTFSGDGQLGFLPQIADVITTEILETDGKIFAFLGAVNNTPASYILQLNSDGSFNTAFDGDGILELPGLDFYDAALSHDGTEIYLLSSDTSGYLLASMDLDGGWLQPYTSVGGPAGTGFIKMLVDDEGRIVIGGGGTNNGEGCVQVSRYHADFTLDITFGNNGTAYSPPAQMCYPLMEIDNLGRIVLGSYNPGCGGLWRFNADGTFDTSFNYTLDLMPFIQDNWIIDFAIAQDNSIYLQPNTYAWPSYLFKLQENGALDESFGNGGHIILVDPEPLWYTAPDELLIDPNGGLIVMAQAYAPDGYISGKYLTRLDANGVIDPDFTPGIQEIDDNGYDLRIHFHCATLQGDGKVLSMDMVVKWLNGELHGYAPLITRFNNSKGAVVAVEETGPRVEVVEAFPNPTSGMVTLLTGDRGSLRNATACITNSVGAMVMQENLINEHIDLSALSPGVYFCLVKHAGGSLHARIVKE